MIEGIISDILDKFKLVMTLDHALEGGWKNRKWKTHGQGKTYCVKELSKERYDDSKLEGVKKALRVHQKVSEDHGLAPKLWRVDEAIVHQALGINYFVMAFEPGLSKAYSSVTLKELNNLGQALAQIHTTDVSHIYGEIKGEDPWETLKTYMNARACDDWSAMPKLGQALDQLAKNMILFEPDFIASMTLGFTHSDFSKDNILFNNQGVKVLDFDRGRINYQLQDLARAIMCFAFDGHKLDVKKIQSLCRGYDSHMKLSITDVVEALKLLWLIEVVWWLKPFVFSEGLPKKIQEFRLQILYLNDNLFDLEALLKDVDLTV